MEIPVRPVEILDVVQLHFDDDEVIFANAGALIFCPRLRLIDIAELMDAKLSPQIYSVLPTEETAMLINALIDEDALDEAKASAPPFNWNGPYAAARA